MGSLFHNFFPPIDGSTMYLRSNHVTNPCDHKYFKLLRTICLFIYNHTKEIRILSTLLIGYKIYGVDYNIDF